MKYFANLDAELSPPRKRAMGREAREGEILEEIFEGGWKEGRREGRRGTKTGSRKASEEAARRVRGARLSCLNST